MPDLVWILDSGEVEAIAHQPAAPITSLRPAYDGQTFDDFGVIPDPLQTPPITFYRITLRNALLSSLPGLEGVVVTEDGRMVGETTFLTDQEDRERVLREAAAAVPLPVPVLHTTDPWFGNYYHWLIVSLGKSLLADEMLDPRVFQVFPEFRRKASGYAEPVRSQTLARFAAGRPRLTLGPGLYRVPELHLLWTDHGHSEFHMVLERFYAPFHTAAAEMRTETRRKLLLLRRDDPRMSAVDVRLLTEVASAHGYAPVHLEDASFDQQLSWFADASHIAAPHGSGLANLVFCPPGARVLELNKDLDGLGRLRPWFHLLANGAGLEYRYLNRRRGDLSRTRLEEAFGRMEA